MANTIVKDSQFSGLDGLYDTLNDQKDFIMKWDFSPISEEGVTATIGSKDIFKPGYTQAEEQKTFMTELSEKLTFVNDSRFITMTGNELDFNLMNVAGKLYHMRQLDGTKQQIDDIRDRPEATPEFGRKILKCEPFYGRSFVNWLTIKENIMQERFVSKFQTDAVNEFKRYAERSVVYGVNKMDQVTSDPETMDMMNCTDGLIQQLGYQRTVFEEVINNGAANHNPLWKRTACGTVTPVDFSGSVEDAVDHLKKCLTQYMFQGGDRSRAKFYMSAEAEAALLSLQEKTTINTEKGASIYFDGGKVYIWGVPCVHADTLDIPDNDQQPHMFLGDLNGFVIGTKQDITTESKWDIFSQGYHAVTKLYWGTLLLEPKKIIGIPVEGLDTLDELLDLGSATGGNSGNSGNSGDSGSGTSP